MAVFNFRPTSADQSKKPRVNIASFGDGYEQREKDGLNNNLMTWSLQFQSVPITDADAIDAFLDARGGAESFDWTPPDKPTGKYKCEEWRRSPSAEFDTVASITATFKQVPA